MTQARGKEQKETHNQFPLLILKNHLGDRPFEPTPFLRKDDQALQGGYQPLLVNAILKSSRVIQSQFLQSRSGSIDVQLRVGRFILRLRFGFFKAEKESEELIGRVVQCESISQRMGAQKIEVEVPFFVVRVRRRGKGVARRRDDEGGELRVREGAGAVQVRVEEFWE